MTPLAIDDDHDTERDDELVEERSPLPGRPRLRLLTRITVPLLALLLVAVGFLVGIEVEKGRGGSSAVGSTSAASTRGGFAGAAGATGATGATGARGAFGRSGTSSGRSGSAGGGFPGGGGAASSADSGDTAGTISSISGDTIYLKTISGDTIKVDLTSVTSLKKEGTVTRNAIRPGDTITVTGISGSGGSIKAASISDSGVASSSSSGS